MGRWLFEEAQRGARTGCSVSLAGKFVVTPEGATRICGVTYGSFRERDGFPFPARETVERDFREIASTGANAVRTYSVPPRWLLDLAADVGLLVMVGLAWESHVAFLDDRNQAAAILTRLRGQLAPIAGHPAILCYAIGNEIPASIVRWHGRRRVEAFLEELCWLVRRSDPGALVTYVNYPSTEYLQLPFLDLVAFNVYLESVDQLGPYLSRLQNLAGDRPLIV
ncbi:MAG: hypothetical protein QOE29_481, partial [Gaiellaceae bacterium]|nr:hypothetical protein [Gaiellaceae bacterium]